jgi:hypothetical protein
MITMLAIQAAAMPAMPYAPPAPPAPPAIMRSFAPPIVVTSAPQSAVRTSDIDVVIRAPSGVLWQGTLRVADRGRESNWSQTRTEPPGAACPTRGYGWVGEREMLSLSLAAPSGEPSSSLAVQVRWARRGDSGCDGLRTVELRETVALSDRRTAVVTGDGGLRVELRRRPSSD